MLSRFFPHLFMEFLRNFLQLIILMPFDNSVPLFLPCFNRPATITAERLRELKQRRTLTSKWLYKNWLIQIIKDTESYDVFSIQIQSNFSLHQSYEVCSIVMSFIMKMIEERSCIIIYYLFHGKYQNFHKEYVVRFSILHDLNKSIFMNPIFHQCSLCFNSLRYSAVMVTGQQKYGRKRGTLVSNDLNKIS